MSVSSILQKKNSFSEMSIAESSFDFKLFEIEDSKVVEELIHKEAVARKNIMQIQRNTLELGKVLSEAQELLANNKNGAFKGWFENLGLKKDFVYREIMRYEVFSRYNNDKIKELPIRGIKYISNPKITEEEVKEIIEAEEPMKKIKEMEERVHKDSVSDIEKIKELEYKIMLAKRNIRKWEKEIQELKEHIK